MGQAVFVETGAWFSGDSFDPRDEREVDMGVFFDVSLDLLVIRDLDGIVIKASRSWQVSMGHSPDELEGKPLLSLLHPEDLTKTRDSVREVEQRKAGDPVLGFINRYRHGDGNYRLLEWRAQRFGDRIYGVARDVTDRVTAEQAVVEAKAAAETANRAKSDFLANMSHEIRTPLNGVIGIVDALSRTDLSSQQAAMVELIRESGVSLERLVSSILDVSKIEAGRLELEIRPFDLCQLLRASTDIVRARAEAKGLSLAVVVQPQAARQFLGDGVRIQQVLINLLSNAVKFTNVGGISVLADMIETTTGAESVQIVVEDTGVGFDADKADRLFDRFTQADSTITRRFGGTGLGLSICHSLVSMMGGDISARSTEGAGSRFEVLIPLAPAGPQRLEVRTETGALPPLATASGQPLRVLLAEDHPINQRVVELILATQSAELTIVEDGAQAVTAFQTGGFDLVLMDMQMPVMDGLSATRAIREYERERQLAPTPVLMLSANAMAEHRRDAAEAGADLHIAKPITAASLLAGIRTGLSRVGSVGMELT